MHKCFFKTSDPLEESIKMSNISELVKKDEEYTKKANEEGKAYYKWDTNFLTLLIYNNGVEDLDEFKGPWGFISHWLALTLKFEDDETLDNIVYDFINGNINYKNEVYGKEIYKIMYNKMAPYLYAIYSEYLDLHNRMLPDFINELHIFYKLLGKFVLWRKLPSEDGLLLVQADKEDVDKYMGKYIAPEEHERINKELEDDYVEFLKK